MNQRSKRTHYINQQIKHPHPELNDVSVIGGEAKQSAVAIGMKVLVSVQLIHLAGEQRQGVTAVRHTPGHVTSLRQDKLSAGGEMKWPSVMS